jgi:hypothetical protein
MRKLIKKVAAKPRSISSKNEFYVQAQRDLRKYYDLPEDDRRLSRPPFDEAVIATDEVASALAIAQQNKCAYCETLLIGDPAKCLSHYRPLSNAIFDLDSKLEVFDRYAWFAYEWQNLLLICSECNQYKLNLFPLSGSPSKPFSTWKSAQVQERPMLMNPYTDNVDEKIIFDFTGLAVGLSEEAKTTIDIMNLNRSQLLGERRNAISEALNKIQYAIEFSPDKLQAEFSKLLSKSIPFYGAVVSGVKLACRYLDASRGFKRLYRDLSFPDYVQAMLEKHTVVDWSYAIERASQENFDFSGIHRNRMRLDLNKFSYLAAVHIKSFKGINDCYIDFNALSHERNSRYAPCTMLLGENAAGKSSILQAISLATMAPMSRRGAGVLIKNLIPVTEFRSRVREEALSVRVEFRDGSFTEMTLRDNRLRVEGGSKGPFLGYGARRFFISGKYNGSKTSRNRTLFDEGASLQDPSLWLVNAKQEKFEAVARALQSLLTLPSDQYIVRDKGDIYIKRPDKNIPIGYLSDGYKTIFALSMDIMREVLETHESLEYAQAIVFIDEIENHLHPSWKKKLMVSLRAAMPRVQFISSTHDPLCLRGMKDGEVRVLYRTENDDVEVLHDLPPISTLRIEQILTSEYFGLASTEDDEQISAANILARYVDRSDDSLSSDERHERDRALREYSGTSLIGSSVDRQIMAEALSGHVKKFASRSLLDKSQARKESVKMIMDVLERALGRDQG